MTEDDARDLLWRFARDGLEEWIVEQPWQAVPGGWIVTGGLQGWRFKIEGIPTGLRITGGEPDADNPAVWVVTG